MTGIGNDDRVADDGEEKARMQGLLGDIAAKLSLFDKLMETVVQMRQTISDQQKAIDDLERAATFDRNISLATAYALNAVVAVIAETDPETIKQAYRVARNTIGSNIRAESTVPGDATDYTLALQRVLTERLALIFPGAAMRSDS